MRQGGLGFSSSKKAGHSSSSTSPHSATAHPKGDTASKYAAGIPPLSSSIISHPSFSLSIPLTHLLSFANQFCLFLSPCSFLLLFFVQGSSISPALQQLTRSLMTTTLMTKPLPKMETHLPENRIARNWSLMKPSRLVRLPSLPLPSPPLPSPPLQG